MTVRMPRSSSMWIRPTTWRELRSPRPSATRSSLGDPRIPHERHHGRFEPWPCPRATTSSPGTTPLPATGVPALCQPLIAPIYGSRQPMESLLKWTKALQSDGGPLTAIPDWHGFIKARWQREVLPGHDGKTWEDALRAGFLGVSAESPFSPRRTGPRRRPWPGAGSSRARASRSRSGPTTPWRTDASPASPGCRSSQIRRASWSGDNAFSVSPATAESLELAEGDRVRITTLAPGGDRLVEGPVLIQPGVPRDVIIATLGHGLEGDSTAGLRGLQRRAPDGRPTRNDPRPVDRSSGRKTRETARIAPRAGPYPTGLLPGGSADHPTRNL